MIPIEERARRRNVSAFAATDTIEVLVDRVEAMVLSGRPMSLVRRYTDSPNSTPSVRPNLRIDDIADQPLSRWHDDDHSGFSVLLGPGLHSFGISAAHRHGDERQVATRFNSDEPRNASLVEIYGNPDDHGSEDRIEVTKYNSNGVGEQVILSFHAEETDRIIEAEAQFVDTLAAHLAGLGHDQAAADLRKVAERRRWNWHDLPEVLAYLSTPGADPRGK